MSAKDYLNRVFILRYQLQRSREELERLYADAAGVRAIVYDRDHVQVSPDNRLEAMFIRIDDESKKWARKAAQYERELRKRLDMIGRMQNPDHALLLILRYIETDKNGRRLTWDAIADRMGWSYSKVTHMHGEALQEFSRAFHL